jgi:hypothetical protein
MCWYSSQTPLPNPPPLPQSLPCFAGEGGRKGELSGSGVAPVHIIGDTPANMGEMGLK